MRPDEPIIKSLLDVDQYKAGMSRMIDMAGHACNWSRYELTNRHMDVVNLGTAIDRGELREQLDHIRSLRFTIDELRWLNQFEFVSEELLAFWALHLDLPEVNIDTYRGGHLYVDVAGEWLQAILWETLIMSVVNELYFRQFTGMPGYSAEARSRMKAKIEKLRRYPGLKVTEFGTRRRFSRAMQELMLGMLVDEIPDQVAGTSNLYLAKQMGLQPVGTMAHELFMGYMGIYGRDDHGLKESQSRVIADWERFLGPKYTIALPDTVTSKWFFENVFVDGLPARWKGTRHDSGDPFAYGEYVLGRYDRFGVDATGKVIVWSDGVDPDLMIALYERFSPRINCAFGWGTNCTNDCGPKPISMVVKLVESNHVPVIKLSDNPAKAIGDPDAIARAKRVFGVADGEVVRPTY